MTEDEGESMRGELGRIWDIDEENIMEKLANAKKMTSLWINFWI
jgi:hypothetical protein